MVFFNHATRQMTAKIVYYGPGLCGKTTNLNTIYGKTSTKARGEMVSLNTETDRTLFFDLLPMDVGMVGGFKTKLQLYTVPGQVFYNSTRKLVLKGVDGIVFVVDSQVPMLDASKESLQNLEENLRELGLKLGDIPTVFQWNKRDLKNIVSVEQLEKELNPRGLPSFQSCAQDGTGVFETLRGITKLSLTHIKTHVLGETTAPPPTTASKEVKQPPIKIVVPDTIPVSTRDPLLPSAVALTTHDLLAFSNMLDEDTGYKALPTPVMPAITPPVFPPLTPVFQDDNPLETKPVKALSAQSMQPSQSDQPDQLSPPDLSGNPLPDEDGADLAVTHKQEEVLVAPVPPAPSIPSVPSVPSEPAPRVAPAFPHGSFSPPTQPLPEPKKPMFSLAPIKSAAPAQKSPNPKDAINSLLGELTMVGKLGTPSMVRVDLPSGMDSDEVEVVVLVKQKGLVIGEGTLKRPAPSKGVAAKLSVELRRP
jgi:small GTP-binding protein